MCWCGSSSVLVYWQDADLLMVGPHSDTTTFFFDQNIVLVPELDGARAISDELHELIERIPG